MKCLVSRVLFLEGAPTIELKPAATHDSVTEILNDAFAAEQAAIARFTDLCKQCYDAGDMSNFHFYQHLVKWHREGDDKFKGHVAWLQKQTLPVEEAGRKRLHRRERGEGLGGTMPLLRTEISTAAPEPARRRPRRLTRKSSPPTPRCCPARPTPRTAPSTWSGTAGPFVPRIDRSTGEPYMLKLDMEGCRFDRLNNGAPVFDTHFTGDDFKSLIAGKVGTRAQLGVVRRAWPNGDKGMATLQFDLGDPDGAEMFRKASTGILQNLSFGTFVYKREKIDAADRGDAGGQAALPERQGNRHVQGHRLGAV